MYFPSINLPPQFPYIIISRSSPPNNHTHYHIRHHNFLHQIPLPSHQRNHPGHHNYKHHKNRFFWMNKNYCMYVFTLLAGRITSLGFTGIAVARTVFSLGIFICSFSFHRLFIHTVNMLHGFYKMSIYGWLPTYLSVNACIHTEQQFYTAK